MKEYLKRIEVLTVLFLIGMLSVGAMLAISGARARARDAVRLSDVRQLQAGVELYFNDRNEYPPHQEWVAVGLPEYRCLGEGGFAGACNASVERVYQQIVPMVPEQGLGGQVACSGARNAYCYRGDGAVYGVAFELERKNTILGLQKGVNCATPVGFVAGACQFE